MDDNKINCGIISRNKKKKEKWHSDAIGSLNVEGVEYWLYGMSKKGKYGDFLSLTIKPKSTEVKKIEPPKEDVKWTSVVKPEDDQPF